MIECVNRNDTPRCIGPVVEKHGSAFCESHLAAYEWGNEHKIKKLERDARIAALEARVAALEKSR